MKDMPEPAIHELAARVSVLEERMKASVLLGCPAGSRLSR